MEKKCKDIVSSAFNNRMADIRELFAKGSIRELQEEYALGIDFVPANTFEKQNMGYTRYQISWGGPSEEFRVYTVGKPRVEFWYIDWYDDAMVTVSRKDANIIRTIVGKSKI